MNRDPIEEAGGPNLTTLFANDAINRPDYLGLSDQLVDCPCDEEEIGRKAAELTKLAGMLSAMKTTVVVDGIAHDVAFEYCAMVCCSEDGKVSGDGPYKGHYRVFDPATKSYKPSQKPEDAVKGNTPTCEYVFASRECKEGDVVRYVHSHPYGGTKPSTGDWGFCRRIPLTVTGNNADDPMRMICGGRMWQYDPETKKWYEIDPRTYQPKSGI